MIELYKNYLFCKNKKAKNLNELKSFIADFYFNYYKKYINHPRNEFYCSFILSYRIKEFMKLTDKPNIKRFFRFLEGEDIPL